MYICIHMYISTSIYNHMSTSIFISMLICPHIERVYMLEY